MAEIYLVTRPEIGYVSHAYTDKADAEKWIEDNIMPNYRSQWTVRPCSLH